MAATATALLALLKAGDEVVCSAAIYGGTLHLIEDLFPRYGIKSRFVPVEELREPEKVIGDGTRLLWFESPINPTLRCVDVEAVGRACRARGVISVVDNTFASPINQQPLPLGIDLVMHSVTKYLNGHSDVTAGALCGSGPLMQQVERARRMDRSRRLLADLAALQAWLPSGLVAVTDRGLSCGATPLQTFLNPATLDLVGLATT